MRVPVVADEAGCEGWNETALFASIAAVQIDKHMFEQLQTHYTYAPPEEESPALC